MKPETTPFVGVACEGSSEIARAELEFRLLLRGFPGKPGPKTRIWTKSEAIEMLQEFNDLSKLGTLESIRARSVKTLEDHMRRNLGFKQFFLIDDPQPGDLL